MCRGSRERASTRAKGASVLMRLIDSQSDFNFDDKV